MFEPKPIKWPMKAVTLSVVSLGAFVLLGLMASSGFSQIQAWMLLIPLVLALFGLTALIVWNFTTRRQFLREYRDMNDRYTYKKKSRE